MTEFKVGDRVRLVGKPYIGNIVGSEGVVTRSYGPVGVYAEFSMQYPNSPEESKVFPYDPDELELCHPEEDAIRNVLWRIQKEIDSYNMGYVPELIERLKTLTEQLTEQRSNQVTFDEETAKKLAQYLYGNTQLVQHDADDMAWEILDNLVTGEWQEDTSKGYSYPVNPIELNNGRMTWQETTND